MGESRLQAPLCRAGQDQVRHLANKILKEAGDDPLIAQNAPYTTPVRRLDEARAAKTPVIRQPL